MKKILLGMVATLVSVSALADNPMISGVLVQQRWPWSRLVDIDYVLNCDPGKSMDIVVEVYDGSEHLDAPEASFSGDLFGVQRGARRVVWDPTMTAYTNNRVIPEFRVALTTTPSPLYVIVDLTKSVGEAEQIEYVYESAITNGVWGDWVRNPVTNRGDVVKSVVWTGVTENDIYKTDKLVLRRISKGTFEMGEEDTTLSTTLTKDFYAGVFQVTQRQWELIMGNNPSRYRGNTRSMNNISYDNIRGATNSVPSINWPGTGTLVEPTSFVGTLRAKTGIRGFDLPTDAQWEYACRAGTTTVFHDGDASANVTGASKYTNEWLNVLGRYKYNGGYIDGVTLPWSHDDPENTLALVGMYLPNAWGLYDMHGNVYELCLDWYESSLEGGIDPKGPESSSVSRRLKRGGSFVNGPAYVCSAFRKQCVPVSEFNIGFRLVWTLP